MYDGCKCYLRTKASHDWFPRRHQGQTIRQTFEKDDLEHWQIHTRHPNAGATTFILDPRRPLKCLRNPDNWQECTNDECLVHINDKAKEWHRLQRQEQSPRSEGPANNLQRIISDLQTSQGITRRSIEKIDEILRQNRQPKNE